MLDNIQKHKENLTLADNKTNQLISMIHLSWDYRNFETDSAIHYSNKAIDLAKTLENDSLLSKALNIKSKLYENIGEYDSAYSFQVLSLNLRTSQDYFGRLNNYTSLINILKNQGKLKLSKFYLGRAHQLFDKALIAYEYTSLKNLFDTYYNVYGGNNYHPDIDNFKYETLDVNLVDRDIAHRLIVQYCNIELSIGEINLMLNNPVTALKNYRNVLKSSYETDTIGIKKLDYVIYAYYGLATCYYKLSNIDSLNKYLELSVFFSRLRPDSLLLAKSYNLAGLKNIKQSNKINAIQKFKQAERILEDSYAYNLDIKLNLLDVLIDLNPNDVETQRLLNELSTKNSRMSISQLQKYFEIQAKHFLKQKNLTVGYEILEQLEQLKTEHEFEKVRSEILEIHELNDIQELTDNIAEQKGEIEILNDEKFLIAMVAIVLTLIILLSIYFTIRINKIKKQLEYANENLQSKNQKLVELDNKRIELFRMLTHDIQTPLTLSSKTLALINDDKLDSSQKDEYINQVNITIDKVSSLVQSILSWLFSPKASIDGEFKNQNLKIIIEDVLTDYDQLISDKNLNLNLKLKDCFKTIDKTTFEIIIKNLMSNAIKFSKQNSNLSLNLDENCLKITNTGIPFDNTQIDEIKNNRRPYSKKGSTGELGNGLGIQIIKNLADFNELKFEIENRGNTTSVLIIF